MRKRYDKRIVLHFSVLLHWRACEYAHQRVCARQRHWDDTAICGAILQNTQPRECARCGNGDCQKHGNIFCACRGGTNGLR